jgi:hypothetical protein
MFVVTISMDGFKKFMRDSVTIIYFSSSHGEN